MRTNQFLAFHVNQDWQANWPEDNSIWRFTGKKYDVDKQLTLCVFEKIGDPVSTAGPPVEIEFVDG